MKTGILFDLDGTLLDTLGDLCDSTNAALAQFGYPARSLAQVRRFVGNGAANLIAQEVPENADPTPVLLAFQAYYPSHCQIKTGPYAGIPEALEALAGKYPVAIVSNKPDTAVKPLCGHYFPGIYALGETQGCPRKPAPDMVYKAMAAIGADCCVYVGDSEVDVATAQNAGMPLVAVSWGFRGREKLALSGAETIVDDAEQLLQALL